MRLKPLHCAASQSGAFLKTRVLLSWSFKKNVADNVGDVGHLDIFQVGPPQREARHLEGSNMTESCVSPSIDGELAAAGLLEV
ncbi:MAG: hypothetical protein KBG84_14420, partial [Planctomycetes bacterium]|nr:hypothetical protein [Planctomycetota bacterium]